MSKQSKPGIDIGIPEDHRVKIAKGLSHLLADSYTLFLKTHHFHWNVTGPMFSTLHVMFEQQYNELFPAIDELAERIRALGEFAPGSFGQFAELSTIKGASKVPSARDMIRELVKDHETIVRTARAIIPDADAAHDESTADLVTQRLQVHEKTAWMLRSMLDDDHTMES